MNTTSINTTNTNTFVSNINNREQKLFNAAYDAVCEYFTCELGDFYTFIVKEHASALRSHVYSEVNTVLFNTIKSNLPDGFTVKMDTDKVTSFDKPLGLLKLIPTELYSQVWDDVVTRCRNQVNTWVKYYFKKSEICPLTNDLYKASLLEDFEISTNWAPRFGKTALSVKYAKGTTVSYGTVDFTFARVDEDDFSYWAWENDTTNKFFKNQVNPFLESIGAKPVNYMDKGLNLSPVAHFWLDALEAAEEAEYEELFNKSQNTEVSSKPEEKKVKSSTKSTLTSSQNKGFEEVKEFLF